MSNWMKARCPACRDTDHIDVTAMVSVRLTSDGSDADEAFNHCHEYDGGSPCICTHCGHTGRLADFQTQKPRRRRRRETRSNETRAEHAASICDAYGNLAQGRRDYDAPEDIATDLIIDLMHLIKAHGVDPLGKLQTATINYEAEQQGEE